MPKKIYEFIFILFSYKKSMKIKGIMISAVYQGKCTYTQLPEINLSHAIYFVM